MKHDIIKVIAVAIAIILLGWFAFCIITQKLMRQDTQQDAQHEYCVTDMQYYSETEHKCVDIPDLRAEKYEEQAQRAEDEYREYKQSIEENNTCNIKGNISFDTGEKIYHVPGQKYYNSTQINESRGERWFCSEEEARAAGWRKSEI